MKLTIRTELTFLV